jgi:hypothetical protein
MRDLGREVEYLVADDEGHGFVGVDNRTALRVAMEKFFAKHLGGRYQVSVKESVAQRLDEMTVPVETVVLEQPEGDIEAAKTAPLPEVNTGNLKPTKLKYAGKAAVRGQEIDLEIAVGCSMVKRGDKEIWRMISEQSSVMGAATDTFDVDLGTLLPVYRGAKQGNATVSINFSDTAVEGAIIAGGQEMPVTTALDAPVYGDGTALDVVLSSLPLAPGYKTTLRMFDILSQSTSVMVLEVVGKETVTVPAGTFEAFKIELKNMDGEPGGGTVHISADKSRHKVRSVMQLPAMMGGGTITSELQAVE